MNWKSIGNSAQLFDKAGNCVASISEPHGVSGQRFCEVAGREPFVLHGGEDLWAAIKKVQLVIDLAKGED